MRIQTTLVGVVMLALMAGFCLSQDAQEQKSDPAQLLADLKSNDPRTRVGAFEQISSNSAMLQDPNVQSALLDLLDLETGEFNARVREGERKGAEHESDASEASDDDAIYRNDLLGTIESFVNWHDPRHICLLAKAGAALDSTDARESATRAQVAMPCLQQLSKSDLFMNRLKAVKITARLLAGAGNSLDPDTTEAMKKAIVLALHDKRVEVQWEAVDWLKRDGTSDMIPALKGLAESNPGPNATEDEIAVRKNAAKAAAAIQEREARQ